MLGEAKVCPRNLTFPEMARMATPGEHCRLRGQTDLHSAF